MNFVPRKRLLDGAIFAALQGEIDLTVEICRDVISKHPNTNESNTAIKFLTTRDISCFSELNPERSMYDAYKEKCGDSPEILAEKARLAFETSKTVKKLRAQKEAKLTEQQSIEKQIAKENMVVWFYTNDLEIREGPISLIAMRKLFQKGGITKDALAWSPDINDWKPLIEIVGIDSQAKNSENEPLFEHGHNGKEENQNMSKSTDNDLRNDELFTNSLKMAGTLLGIQRQFIIGNESKLPLKSYDHFSLGYIVGFCAAICFISGIIEHTKIILHSQLVYRSIFGELEALDLISQAQVLTASRNQDYLCGRTKGAEELQKAQEKNFVVPPLGWANHVTL